MTLVVSTTNRPHSLTEVVAHYYHVYLKHRGIDTKYIRLIDLPKDFINSALYHNKGGDKTFNILAEQMGQADKFIFVVPEYHGSFPGVFKAFIDGLDKYVFKGKKCALVGVSRGRQGAMMALSHLTDIFHHLSMTVYPMKPKLSQVSEPTLAGLERHQGYLARLEEQADGFIDF